MKLDKVRAPRPQLPAPRKVEAYGVSGMASKPWRRTFASEAAYLKWSDSEAACQVTVYGYRDLEAGA